MRYRDCHAGCRRRWPLVVTVFVSPLLASMAVDRFTFESPDEVGNLEDGVYMLTNLAALLSAGGSAGSSAAAWSSRATPLSSTAAHETPALCHGRRRPRIGARHLVNVGFGRWLGDGLSLVDFLRQCRAAAC